jgi:AsmA protein
MKALKIAGYSIAALLALLIVAAITLSLVFDPNQYKPEIIRLVKEKTGRDLRIEKKIGWSFFPRLGIEAGGVDLSNAPGFGKEPFAKIDAAGVHVAVLPLFTGRIEIGSLYLHGLNLNLAKDAGGRSNWDDLAAKKEPKTPEPKPEKKPDGKLPLEGLAIGRLDIQRATIIWRDAGNVMAVKNLNLATSRFVAGEPMDLKLSFELDRAKTAPVKAALNARLTATSDALKLANVDLKVDDSRLTGNIDVHNFASPALRFDLALDKIDLDRYLGAGAAEGKKPAEAKTKTTASEKPTEIPLSTLRGLNVDGKFRIDQLKAFGLKSSEAKIALTAKNGLITLGPNSAKLYQGRYQGQTALDARGQTLQLSLNEKLEGVQLGPLLKDMQLFDHYSGAGNVDLRLTANGFNASQVKRSLNGNATVSIKDGRIDGVDLGKFVKTLSAKGDALTKATRLIPEKGDHTVFGQMNASFQIANGVARNRDLVVRAADFSATGKGEANLVSEKMDYRLDLAEKGNEGKKCKTLPVRIDGPFANLSYLPDMEEILRCQTTKKAEKQLKKGLGDLLAPKKKKK